MRAKWLKINRDNTDIPCVSIPSLKSYERVQIAFDIIGMTTVIELVIYINFLHYNVEAIRIYTPDAHATAF